MSDPFAELWPPFWRRIWRRNGSESAPKRWSVAAGVVSSIGTGIVLPSVHGIDKPTKVVIFLFVASFPTWLAERWWKERRRRASEQLLPRPE